MRSTDNHYWVALDHVRALAALTVFLWHFVHGPDGSPVPFAGAPLVPPFAIFDEGHTGVAIFMTLSGYLFAKLLDGKDIIYKRFYLNRALRLFPLLLLVMALKAMEMVVFNYGDLAEYGRSLLTGFAVPSWPNGGWSIAVELHFYLLLPFLLLLARHKPMQLLAIVGAAILLRVTLFGMAGSIQDLAYWTIIGRIDQFVLGILFFMYRDSFAGRVPLALAVFAGFYLIFWLFNAAGGFYSLGGSEPSPSPLWIIMPTLEGLTYATAIACYDRNMKPGSGWFSRIWAEYGKFSYSIYLLHFFVVFRAAEFINERLFSLANFYVASVTGALLFLAMYPASWVSYRFVEEPFLRFRKRYTVSRTSPELIAS